MKRHTPLRQRRALSLMTRCVLVAMLPATAALAIEFDTGNPDLAVRWDNTIRYNLGIRAESQDPRIMKATPISDGKFARGDIVTNRVDVLSEVDAVYQGKHGARLSAAAWYDQAYNNSLVSATSSATFPGGHYNDTTRRFYEGPSGEILDAFVFTNFDLGSVPVGLRVGKHVVYWGEGLLIGGHAVSYSQAPSDGRKAVSSPGIETKEVFMPINQISFNAQLNNELSIGGQYFLDWKGTRVPLGGTYFAASDSFLFDKKPADKSGAYGLKLAYNLPDNAKLGVYYRKYDDYSPWSGGIHVDAGGQRLAHADNVKLVGVSLGATVAGTSVGWELSRRSNAPLTPGGAAAGALLTLGPRGTTTHMILNAVRALPNLPIYDTGTVIAELAYSHLNKVTNNAAYFKGEGYATCTKTAGAADLVESGCATKNYWGMALSLSPQYLQVAPGLDLTVPLTLNYGIKGNAATGGGVEGEYSWSVGLDFMYQSKHNFVFKYQDKFQHINYNPTTGLISGANGSTYAYNDKGFLSFTYKTSF